jgi:hypothetical protein
MGSIMSPVEAVDQIHWTRATGRRLKARSIVIVPQQGQHDLMIAALEDGSFCCSRDISKYAYMPGQWPWMDGVIKGLVKLGAITQSAAATHMAACAEASRRSSNRHQAEMLERMSEETGLPLSPEQAAFVAEHSRRKARAAA